MILNASITQGDTVWLVRLILMDKNMILTIFNVNVNERVGEMLRFVKIPIQIVSSPYLILSEALLLLAESIYI